ncbi:MULTISPECIES: tetratricopeptide repeat protein [Pontibacillus]|uniref:Tetratricopeptide repeat protein n=1 Tax=Pontibacillus chungwhensis TaxID=265426 RepID=A0ABY8UVS6_9BACI|nr:MULTISPECIES: hypothetical protein [Pontibacillus]MCD5324156.1 hypothetical protein [Pontibacillus sp. HN14]WIF97785.1 hypothetical protein QNI29_18985 [Pontibacillus chungwhensis]
MDKHVNQYNEAIHLLKEERYLEAETLLAPLHAQYPNEPSIRWSLGLAYALMGYPQKSVELWKGIPLRNEYPIERMEEEIRKNESTYNEAIQAYNDGLIYLKQKDPDKANLLFQRVLSIGEKIILPFPVYKAAVLHLLHSDRYVEAESVIENLPPHCVEDPQLHTLREVVNTAKVNKKSDYATKKESKSPFYKGKRTLYVLGLASCLALGFYTTTLFSGDVVANEDKRLQEKIEVLNEENQLLMEQNTTLEVEKGELKSSIKNLKVTDSSKNAKNQADQSVKEVINQAGMNVKDIYDKASIKLYRKGLSNYQHGDYASAITELKESYSLSQDRYYSDDALYHLIVAMDSTNIEVMEYINEFLESNNTSFIESPYRDDLILLKAKNMLVAEKERSAEKVLEELVMNYKGEWTAGRAEELLADLREGDS